MTNNKNFEEQSLKNHETIMFVCFPQLRSCDIIAECRMHWRYAHNNIKADSEIVMVDMGFRDDFFELNQSWDDFGTATSEF